MRTRILTLAILLTLLCPLTTPAAIVLFDDFESPGVGTTYNPTNTSRVANSNWVRANQGFGGDRNGIINEGVGNFTDPEPGKSQAYGFRYTNSGVTTAQGVIGSLTSGQIINVSFDVVLDGWNDTTPYTAYLVLFDPAANRNTMNTATLLGTAATLAEVSGNATNDGLYTLVTFSYTVGDDVIFNAAGGTGGTTFLPGLLGKDIGLRFRGATSTAIIDNVQVEIIPEPASLILLGLGSVMVLSRRRCLV